MTGRTRTDATAHVLKIHPVRHSDVEEAAWESCLAVRDLRRVDLYFGDCATRRNVGHCIRFLRELNVRLFYIGIGSTHTCSFLKTVLTGLNFPCYHESDQNDRRSL